MKRKPTPVFKIGMFVLAGFILLVVFIFLLGSKNKLFSSTTEIKARFLTVSSLKKGAQIQMAGINVGSVKTISLPKNARDSVTVTMKIETDAIKLIHTDSKALIGTEGLIGEKIITISMGGDSTRVVSPGYTLIGQQPKDFSAIYDTVNNTISKVNQLTQETVDLVASVKTGNGSLARLLNDDALYRNANATMVQTQATVQDARNAINHIGTSFDGVTTQLNDITTRINKGEGSIGKLLSRDDVYDNVRKTTDNLASASNALTDALAKIGLGSGRFAEVMEALKHNFLVKSYFEDRGYWDAPEFEMTIDRKIDSLNRLRDLIEKSRITKEASIHN